jgi:hypothetical protein
LSYRSKNKMKMSSISTLKDAIAEDQAAGKSIVNAIK